MLLFNFAIFSYSLRVISKQLTFVLAYASITNKSNLLNLFNYELLHMRILNTDTEERFSNRYFFSIFQWHFVKKIDKDFLKKNYWIAGNHCRKSPYFINLTRFMSVTLLRLLVKQNALVCQFLFLLSKFSGISENLEQQNNLQTVKQLIQILINFSGLFFFWICCREEKFPRKCVINIATWLFEYQ